MCLALCRRRRRFAWTPLLSRIEDTNRALGRLDGVTSILPDPSLFIYMYVRKEALFSSQIEGTQSSLSDLLLFESAEAPGVPLDDVEEVSSYVSAMNFGLDRLRGGFPLSLRLIREIHAVLLAKGRGSSKEPGEFRRTQNWIGGTRPGNAVFVPPPPDKLMECLDAFERFLHVQDKGLPTLIKTALAHVQFETIHPFLDGNGRLGRLLNHLPARGRGRVEGADPLFELVFQDPPSALLRSSAKGSRRGRLGKLARLLSGRRQPDLQSSGGHGARDVGVFLPRIGQKSRVWGGQPHPRFASIISSRNAHS